MFLSLSSSATSYNKDDSSNSRITKDFSFECIKNLTAKKPRFESSGTLRNIKNLDSCQFSETNNEMMVKCYQLKNTFHFKKPLENTDKIEIKGISIKSIKFAPLNQDDNTKINFYEMRNKNLLINSKTDLDKSKFKQTESGASGLDGISTLKSLPENEHECSPKKQIEQNELKELKTNNESLKSEEIKSSHINNSFMQIIENLSIKSDETTNSQVNLKNFEQL